MNDKDFEKRFAIGEIKSETENGKIEEPLEDFIINKCGNDEVFCIILYKYNEVLLGTVVKGEISIEKPEELTAECVLEMRIFNISKELSIWKDGSDYKYRIRTDETPANGNKTNVYDVFHMLWGEEKEGNNILTEKRGMRIKLPFEIGKPPVFYKVRNYFKYDDKGQIEFCDARIMSFVSDNGEVLNAKI